MLISKFDNSNINIYLDELEKKYNFIFPEEYKNFLLKYNGGKTPETEFKINGISSDIQGFYGFGNADQYYHFDCLESSGKILEWFDDKMFPIATNVFNDYIMISIDEDEDKNGKIYFYYHDRTKKYIELEQDFKTFVEKCKSKKVGHIRTIEERKEDMIKLGKGDRITPEKIAGWQAEIDEYTRIHQEKLVLD